MERKILAEITHNMRVKTYPDGTQIFCCASSPIYRESGWELSEQTDGGSRSSAQRDGKIEDLQRAKRRAAMQVFDIAYASEFRYFVTLTLDADKVDRYDVKEVTRKLNNWLDNKVRRNGLRYVLVPERHQDGAIHFHGFFNDALPVVDSGTLSNGGKPKRFTSEKVRARKLAEGWHVVYNLPSWSLGFTTAIELYGDKRAAVGYVCKYITKATEKVGGRWYYSGGDISRPVTTLLDGDFADFAEIEGVSQYRIDRIGVDILQWEVKGEML